MPAAAKARFTAGAAEAGGVDGTLVEADGVGVDGTAAEAEASPVADFLEVEEARAEVAQAEAGKL